MENSKIAWTHHTFNPWIGCTKVSEDCKNCYAETLDNRHQHGTGVSLGRRRSPPHHQRHLLERPRKVEQSRPTRGLTKACILRFPC